MTPKEYDELYERVYAPVYEWDQEEHDYYNERYEESVRRKARAEKSRADAIATRRREAALVY